MAARSKARYLAPLALLAVIVAAVVLIGQTERSSSPSRESGASLKARASSSSPATPRRRRHRSGPARTYVVQNGDFLSSIAQKTGVSVAKLQELNVGVDPQTLHAGQRLKLR